MSMPVTTNPDSNAETGQAIPMSMPVTTNADTEAS
jgi:hypothetical protein